MNLLIDTHLLIWAGIDRALLPRRASVVMGDPQVTLWFSIVSVWEVAIKRALKKPDFVCDPGPFRAGLLASGYSEVAVEGRHCLALATLPALHGDPFDRMLVSQAAAEGMTLLTADRRLAAYGGPVLLV